MPGNAGYYLGGAFGVAMVLVLATMLLIYLNNGTVPFFDSISIPFLTPSVSSRRKYRRMPMRRRRPYPRRM